MLVYECQLWEWGVPAENVATTTLVKAEHRTEEVVPEFRSYW